MSKEFLFIGDIAGQYDALLRLLQKCPDYPPVSLGDMVDRGPESKKVLDHFMQHGSAILGNHEHMMLDFAKGHFYERDVWFCRNGGKYTVANWIPDKELPFKNFDEMRKAIPEIYFEWLASLPLYIDMGDALITHAPLHPDHTLEECSRYVTSKYISYSCDASRSLIWNRENPRRIEGKYQIFGHNGFHYFLTDGEDENEEYAVCIDGSRQGQLVAMAWPSRETFVEVI
jgi:serine/threonine protein phosphatase 1